MRSLFALGLLLFIGLAASCGTSVPPKAEEFNSSGGKGGAMCATGQTSCYSPGTATGTACVDLKVDLNNCGKCGTVCGNLQTCSNSLCACTGGLLLCGAACTNPMSDAANCGGCGKACSGATPFCSMGACSASCSGTELACGNSCVQSLTDPTHCGSCTNVCQGGQACSGGVCGCPAGQSTCTGICVDLKASNVNCGTCGHACALSETCTNGACVAGGVGGSAGTSSVGGAGGMSTVGGAAGTGVVSGGTGGGGTGGAGAGGSAGTGTAGMGAAGAPTTAERMGCGITPGLIADFEEGTNTMAPIVLAHEDRTGEFEMFNDKTQTNQTMAVESSGGSADCDKWALHVKGSGYSDWGAGFGFSFVGPPTGPTPYNATAHTFSGIRFKAKAGSGADPKSPVRFNVSTPWTEDKANPGGQCTATTASTNKAAIDCYQHAGRFLPPGSGAGQLSSNWQTYSYCFDRDLYPLSLPSNLTTDQRNSIATNMLKIQFQFNAGKDYSGGYTESDYPAFAKSLAFDFWLDQVEFITGACTEMVTSPSNGSPAKAFPQNAKYGNCDVVPNANVYNGQIVTAYNTWKANFVRNNTVIAPEQSNVVTSESMGYGMLIAVAMGDKTLFDSFWGYVKGKLSGGLMTWKDGQSGSASDGDLDIAYALYLAGKQWSGGSYASDASSMAGNISSKDIVSGIVRGGSSFQNSNFNASYFIPLGMRKLGISLGSNYSFVNTNVNAGAAKVPTDWGNPSSGAPSDAGSAQVTSDITDGGNGAMGYDAARVPWRLGQDVCAGGATDGSASVSAMVSYFGGKYDSGASIDLMKAGWYKAKDAPHTAAKDVQGSFIGPMGIAGMAANNAAMRDRSFRAVLDIMESGDFNHTYFPCTIGFITALIMSGNFPAL